MVVLAGATGHVGSAATERLLDAGKRVRVVVRDAARGERWKSRGAEVAVGDLADAPFVAGALRGAESFFAMVPPNYGVSDVYGGQKQFSDAMASAVESSGVPHVVQLSSVGAHLLEGTGPIKGLHYFEERLKETGTKLSAIRASYFQENAAMALEPARQQGIFPNFGDRDDVAFPMVATKDVGAAVAEALLNPPRGSEVVDVLGPAYSPRDVAAALGAALGRKLRVINIPESEYVGALSNAGLPPSGANSLAEMYRAANKGLLRPVGDRQVQGRTTLEETVRQLIGAGAGR
jgi:uncharacterized protein YbjT (DUF2867 family)